jgi:hypothetical protein
MRIDVIYRTSDGKEFATYDLAANHIMSCEQDEIVKKISDNFSRDLSAILNTNTKERG